MIGLNDSEILELMLDGACPDDTDETMDTYDCPVPSELKGVVEVDCLDCWRMSLEKEYEVESEE